MPSYLFSRRLSRSLIFLFLLLTFSCATQTGTKLVSEESQLAQIHRLGVSIIEETGFQVFISKDQMTGIGANAGGLVGLAVEHHIRENKDQAVASQFETVAAKINLKAFLLENTIDYLNQAGKFDSIVGVADPNTASANPDLDGVMTLTIKEWGLHVCPGNKELVQIAFNINSTLLLKQTNASIWERDDQYYAGKCYALQELESNSELFKGILHSAMDTVSGRIVNEMIFQ